MVLHSMEPTFYEDDQYFTFNVKSEDGIDMGEHVTQLKKSMTLDLKGQQRGGRGVFSQAPVLSSPDLNMLKLGSPELEKLIIAQQNGLVTTTPTPTTQILFPRTVTEEQERYARGFVDALNELHHSDSSQMSGAQHRMADTDTEDSSNDGTSPSSSPASSVTYTNLEPTQGGYQHHHHHLTGGGHAVYAPSNVVVVKDEPQTVPASVGGGSSASSSPAQLSTSVSPIDMECQERIKLERKRQRNRIAASKCRRRKLERIARLEDKVRLLKGENSELSGVVNRLKEQVCALKEQVMDHVHSGCQIMVSSHF
ncbi:transcription factor AP-1 [Ischnura elegans]|uniref:transcription factor AP-1 n=1 Tax=Ischnura elegans TaxID=197161 RepID=UPI001ED8B9AC|nr:transcription factor AP-1 [Ischnura elegans]